MKQITPQEAKALLQELAMARQHVVNAIAAASHTHQRLLEGSNPNDVKAHEDALREFKQAQETEEALWGDIRKLTEPTP